MVEVHRVRSPLRRPRLAPAFAARVAGSVQVRGDDGNTSARPPEAAERRDGRRRRWCRRARADGDWKDAHLPRPRSRGNPSEKSSRSGRCGRRTVQGACSADYEGGRPSVLIPRSAGGAPRRRGPARPGRRGDPEAPPRDHCVHAREARGAPGGNVPLPDAVRGRRHLGVRRVRQSSRCPRRGCAGVAQLHAREQREAVSLGVGDNATRRSGPRGSCVWP
mmetsp:Transcript_19801/g.54598  ORF Transcript_19801/g.54598 Transcript_19801/m.54598 type:complete len:220 (-) Transcript_19801:821-1480(-)